MYCVGARALTEVSFSSLSVAKKGPLSAIPDEELTPRVRELLDQQLDENQLLSSALAKMRERIEELERLVDSDTLTPLPNRRRFVREVERVVQHGRRYGALSSWVMFVDLDGLKQINDSFGHLSGDAALIHVANILQTMVRTTDVVARIGGDEFGLLLEHIDAEAVRDKAQRLIEAVLEQPVILGGKRVRLSISIGLAELNADDDAETLIARADSAMYARRAQVRSAR
jgi:diguanylate cyclase (GGDEF)-like protein